MLHETTAKVILIAGAGMAATGDEATRRRGDEVSEGGSDPRSESKPRLAVGASVT